jgi:hypothetical protein
VAGPPVRGGERPVFLGSVVPDRMHPHDLPVAGHLHRVGDDRDLHAAAPPGVSDLIHGAGDDSCPALSTTRVTVIPEVAWRAVRRPCTGCRGSVSGLRRWTCSATSYVRCANFVLAGRTCCCLRAFIAGSRPNGTKTRQPVVQCRSFSGFRTAQMRMIRSPETLNAMTVTVTPSC